MKPKEFVKEYSIKSLVCCFSGGKDSLCATHYVLSELEDVDIEKYVVFVDTTVTVPIAIEYVKDVAARFGWPLKILKPEPDFWTLCLKHGTPGIKRRWCCYELKLKPIFGFVKQLKPQRAMVTGLRKDESVRRRKLGLKRVIYVKRDNVNAWAYAPILDWSEKDVLNYIKRHNLPMPPHYAMGIGEVCICGAFTHRKELMIVRARFPDFFQKFVQLQEQYGAGHVVFWDRGPLDPRELIKQKTLNEYPQQA